MRKCRRKQTTDPQKLKNCQRSFSRFLLAEAEAEAIDEIAACTSLVKISHPGQRRGFQLSEI